jgi:hypothetical protein
MGVQIALSRDGHAREKDRNITWPESRAADPTKVANTRLMKKDNLCKGEMLISVWVDRKANLQARHVASEI